MKVTSHKEIWEALNKTHHGKVLHYTTIGQGIYPRIYFQSIQTWRGPMWTYHLLRAVERFVNEISVFLWKIEAKYTVEHVNLEMMKKEVKING